MSQLIKYKITGQLDRGFSPDEQTAYTVIHYGQIKISISKLCDRLHVYSCNLFRRGGGGYFLNKGIYTDIENTKRIRVQSEIPLPSDGF